MCLPTVVFRSKLGPCRRFVCMGCIWELVLEHVCHYLVAVGNMTRDDCDGYISWMRSNDWVLYLLAMMMSFIRWTLFSVSTSNNETKLSNTNKSNTTDVTMLIQMNQVLDELKNKFEMEQNMIHSHLENLSMRGHKFEQQILELKKSTPHPFEQYHAYSFPTIPEERIGSMEQDDSLKIGRPCFLPHSASALISPWSPTKQHLSCLNRNGLVSNETFDSYRTPTSHASFNDKIQSYTMGDNMTTQGIMANHRHQSNDEDHHSSQHLLPLSSFLSSSCAKQSNYIEDGENDSFDDCRSHDSNDISMVEIPKERFSFDEAKEDAVYSCKRKRENASNSMPTKRQK